MATVRAGQRELKVALARLRERSGPAVAADPVAAMAVLGRLAPMLASDYTEANAVYCEAESLLLATFGQVAQSLGERIRAFDYPAALETIAAIQAGFENSHVNGP